MVDYIVSFDAEEHGSMSDRIRSKRSATGAVAEALDMEPLQSWLEDEVVDEDTELKVTTETTEKQIRIGDVLN